MIVCPCCGKPKRPIKFDGFGTALKPAMELIALARNPLSEPTIAENVLRWGTGAVNISACRVSSGESTVRPMGTNALGLMNDDGWIPKPGMGGSTLGRWPANLVITPSPEVLAGFPDTGISIGGGMKDLRKGALFNGETNPNITDRSGFGDSGSAARFFTQAEFTELDQPWLYCAKASKQDRAGSRHPTIKPQKLMRHLVRLITPPGGTVLDCFAGTGSTAEAAFREGFNCVLIEREAEYIADIERRMKLMGHKEGQDEILKAWLTGAKL